MARYLLKTSPERDAYIEWSTVVDNPVSLGSRSDYASIHGEDRLARTDEFGTSAMWAGLPGDNQPGGWGDKYLIVMNNDPVGLLPRSRLDDLYDLLVSDINTEIPGDWLEPFED